VQFGDGAVDAGSETEVVGVEDEARGHREILSGSYGGGGAAWSEWRLEAGQESWAAAMVRNAAE
jgi:hypothetical protein